MISRRNFFQDSLAVVSAGIAVPSIFAKAVAAASEQNYGVSTNGKTVVVIQMAGGVDGLNTVIPYNDPAYHDNRKAIAARENEQLIIDDRIAFDGSLAKMKE